jgi:hypothetical protein
MSSSKFANDFSSSNDNFTSSSSDEDILKNMNKNDGNNNFQFQGLIHFTWDEIGGQSMDPIVGVWDV